MSAAGAAFFSETLGVGQFVGVGLVALGIVALGSDGIRRDHRGMGAALINAGVIAGYTLVDGFGARASLAPATYTAWILVGGGIATVAWSIVLRGTAGLAALRSRVPLGLAGGVMGFGAYAIALWAMTVAPIGAVAAVRESSVLFATALGAVLLGERFGPARWIAAACVVSGLALVKIGSG